MTKSSLNIISLPSLELAVAGAAEKLLAEIDMRIKLKKKVLLLLAGGSATKIYAHAAQLLKAKKLSSEHFQNVLSIALEDERWPEKNNTRDLLATEFVQVCQDLGAEFLPLPTTLDLTEAAVEYEEKVMKYFNDSQVEVIVVIGMGGDGHILGVNVDTDASRFTELFSGQSLFVGYTSHSLTAQFPAFPHRLTLTLTGLQKADCVLGLVAGAEKVPVLKQLHSQSTKPINVLPAQALQTLNSHLFIDQSIQFNV